ncbi:MAG: DUF5615 family PIN-like protein [Betaproteobacteria bacterium]
MKLLFDENLSPRLVASLATEFPESLHVETTLGRGRSDAEIWQHAAAQGHTIVSKDNDFRQRAFLSGPPPKVVWLSVGTASTGQVIELLRRKNQDVNRFGESAEALLVLER